MSRDTECQRILDARKEDRGNDKARGDELLKIEAAAARNAWLRDRARCPACRPCRPCAYLVVHGEADLFAQRRVLETRVVRHGVHRSGFRSLRG